MLRTSDGSCSSLVFCIVHCVLGEYWSECEQETKSPSRVMLRAHVEVYMYVCVQCLATANLQTHNTST